MAQAEHAPAGRDTRSEARQRRARSIRTGFGHAVTHLDEDPGEVLGGRRGRADEDGRCAAGAHEDAIEDQYMEMERWT